jgi:hypothetical protein
VLPRLLLRLVLLAAFFHVCFQFCFTQFPCYFSCGLLLYFFLFCRAISAVDYYFTSSSSALRCSLDFLDAASSWEGSAACRLTSASYDLPCSSDFWDNAASWGSAACRFSTAASNLRFSSDFWDAAALSSAACHFSTVASTMRCSSDFWDVVAAWDAFCRFCKTDFLATASAAFSLARRFTEEVSVSTPAPSRLCDNETDKDYWSPSDFPTMKPSQSAVSSLNPSSPPTNDPASTPNPTGNTSGPSSLPSLAPSVRLSPQPTTVTSAPSPISTPSLSPTKLSRLDPTEPPSATSSPSNTELPWLEESATRFYAIGDVPYTTGEARELEWQIQSLAADAEFLIHVGDIRSARDGLSCEEEEYTAVANILNQSKVPVFLVLGGKCGSPLRCNPFSLLFTNL